MPSRQAEFPQGRSIGPKLVGDDRCWREALALEQLSHQLECGSLVTFGLDQEVRNLAFSVDGSPEVHLLSADLYKHLVQVPTIIDSWPEASEPPGIAVSELENPTTHCLVRYAEAAPGQQILDVSEAQREAAIEPHGVLNDPGRKAMAAIRNWFHCWKLDRYRQITKPMNVTRPIQGLNGGGRSLLRTCLCANMDVGAL